MSTADNIAKAHTEPQHRVRALLPIAVSLVALAISSLSLFLTQLQPARVRAYPSEFAYVMAHPNNLEFNLALTFTNDGAAPAVIHKIALLVRPQRSPDGYILQAAYVNKLEKGNFAPEAVMAPIPIDGHRTVNKQILFISARDKPNEHPLAVEGSYEATILLWTSQTTHPEVSTSFPFVVTATDLEALEAQRRGDRTESIELNQDQFRLWSARPLKADRIHELLQRVAH